MPFFASPIRGRATMMQPMASQAYGVNFDRRWSGLADSVHPGPASVAMSAELVQALIDHARADYPNEMCGVIVGDRPAADGGHPLRWRAARNKAASPLRYEIHPDDLLRLTIE